MKTVLDHCWGVWNSWTFSTYKVYLEPFFLHMHLSCEMILCEGRNTLTSFVTIKNAIFCLSVHGVIALVSIKHGDKFTGPSFSMPLSAISVAWPRGSQSIIFMSEVQMTAVNTHDLLMRRIQWLQLPIFSHSLDLPMVVANMGKCSKNYACAVMLLGNAASLLKRAFTGGKNYICALV